MPKRFDVFLSYNRSERLDVLTLAEALRDQASLEVWLDEWVLPPGEPWQQALEEAIATIPAAAVLVGEHGRGPWQDIEMRSFLTEFVKRKARIIPVLLPKAPDDVELPPLLNQFNWLDLREGLTPDGIDRLVWGIRGRRAKKRSPQSTVPKPKYQDHRTKTLSEALSKAYHRKEEAAIRGGDLSEIEREIIELRRSLREGGRLRAGDFLENSEGKAAPITGRLLGEHLKSLPNLRLVVLNSCKGGAVPRRRGQDPFSGAATALVMAGIPAVVAMQTRITDAAAIAFSSSFYARLAAGDPVDAAAVEGRLAMLHDLHDQPGAWASVVVFTRIKDGDILGRTSLTGTPQPPRTAS